MLSVKKAEYFKQLLETRIAELECTLRTAERDVRAMSVKHAGPADQAASEYERQGLTHEMATARQTLKDVLSALQQGRFGECADCGGEIESKRLGAIPWARYCIAYQEAREHH